MTLSSWWRTFQDKVRNSRFFAGYKVKPQQTLETGKRPDYVAVSKENPQQKAVADAKFVKELTPQNVKQVEGYKTTLSAKKAAIFVPKKTRIPRKVRAQAADSDIEIIRKRARPEKVRAYA